MPNACGIILYSKKRNKKIHTWQPCNDVLQGWRGGAERGFLAEYPDLVHMLSRELAEGNESLVEWSRKVGKAENLL